MTLVDTPPKHIYIWVPDNQFSYVFTGSSMSAIGNDWVVDETGGITYDSTKGIYHAYSGSSGPCLTCNTTINLSTTLTTRFTLTAQVRSRDSSGSNAGMSLQVCPSSSTSVWDGMQVQDNGYDLGLQTIGGDAWRQSSVATQTDGTIVATWNFSTGTASVTSFGRTASGTIGSGGLALAQTYTTIKVRPGTVRVKSITLEWE